MKSRMSRVVSPSIGIRHVYSGHENAPKTMRDIMGCSQT
jgi:hypothetical protein